MRELPLVTVGILTYKRLETLQRTIMSLREHIIYPPDKLRWVISDDCSGDGYLDALARSPILADLNVRFISTRENSGWGANANNLLQHCETSLIYLTEDDWQLCQTLDLRAGAGLLETRADVGMLRYGGTSGDMIYHYRQNEADVSEYVQENIHAHDFVPGKLTYLVINYDSPTLYVYSGRPQFAKLEWYQALGYFPEGLRAGATEEAMAHKFKDYCIRNQDAQQIAILPDFINMKYRHIGGQSWQGSEVDKVRAGI